MVSPQLRCWSSTPPGQQRNAPASLTTGSTTNSAMKLWVFLVAQLWQTVNPGIFSSESLPRPSLLVTPVSGKRGGKRAAPLEMISAGNNYYDPRPYWRLLVSGIWIWIMSMLFLMLTFLSGTSRRRSRHPSLVGEKVRSFRRDFRLECFPMLVVPTSGLTQVSSRSLDCMIYDPSLDSYD